MNNSRSGNRYRRLATAATSAAVAGIISITGVATAQASPQQKPVHYYQWGYHSTYILPVAQPVAWDIVRRPGATPELHITVKNNSKTPTVVEVHSALASANWKRVRVPAGGHATAVIPVTQDYVLSRWNRGLGVTGTITVSGGHYKANTKRWNKASKNAEAKGFRSNRLAFYRLGGYQVSGISILPETGIDPEALASSSSPLRQSPPTIEAGQLKVIGEIHTLTGNLPEGGTSRKVR